MIHALLNSDYRCAQRTQIIGVRDSLGGIDFPSVLPNGVCTLLTSTLANLSRCQFSVYIRIIWVYFQATSDMFSFQAFDRSVFAAMLENHWR